MATTAALTDRYVTALRDRLGWDFQVLEHGAVAFEVDGMPFIIENDAVRDPEFFNVVMVTTCETAIAPEVIASVDYKALKIAQRGEFLVFGFESFIAPRDTLPSADLVAGVLPRAVAVIAQGAQTLGEKLTLAGILAATEAQEGAA